MAMMIIGISAADAERTLCDEHFFISIFFFK